MIFSFFRRGGGAHLRLDVYSSEYSIQDKLLSFHIISPGVSTGLSILLREWSNHVSLFWNSLLYNELLGGLVLFQSVLNVSEGTDWLSIGWTLQWWKVMWKLESEVRLSIGWALQCWNVMSKLEDEVSRNVCWTLRYWKLNVKTGGRG